MVEWNQIAKDAEENTVNEARKKYYGVAPDGKTKIYLTRNQIKKKIDEMKDFDEQYFEHFMRFDLLQTIYCQIVSEDSELYAIYEKMSREYDKEPEQYQQEEKCAFFYIYYKHTRYDNDLYVKQKEECKKGLRKSKPDGMIEHRINKSDIPSHLLPRV